MMKLYEYEKSSASYRVRIALNYKELPYSSIPIDLRTGQQSSADYVEVNVAKLVPALQLESHQVISQSLAIIEYLEEAFPEHALLPSRAIDRAYVRSLAFNVSCDIHPLNNLRVLNYLTQVLGHSEDDKNTWYQHWIRLGLESLERQISTSKFYTGKFCYREQFSLADICLIPQLFNARRFKCDVADYPILLEIEAHALQLSAVIKAQPQ